MLRVERTGTIGEDGSYFLIPGFKFSDHIQAFLFGCNKLPSTLFLDISAYGQIC